jgi:hypothetical protein
VEVLPLLHKRVAVVMVEQASHLVLLLDQQEQPIQVAVAVAVATQIHRLTQEVQVDLA